MSVNQTLVAGMDESLVHLIDQGSYFGPGGALGYFSKQVRRSAYIDLTYGIHEPSMQYINVLYSAMTSAATGPTSQKFRVIDLAIEANRWADSVRSCTSYHGVPLQVGEQHILMSVAARSLQIMKRLRLLKLLPKVVEKLEADVLRAFNAIQKIAQEERLTKGSTSMFDQGHGGRLHLLAQVLLHELSLEGVCPHKDINFDHVKSYAYKYAMWHKNSTDRDMVQVVCRILRAIGFPAIAEDIAKSAGNLDQAQKAKMTQY